MRDVIKVFRSELYKITKRKSLYFLMLFMALSPIVNIVMSIFSSNMTTTGFDCFSIVGPMWFPIIGGVFIAGAIGEDYTCEGIKQIASCGIPRRKFIVGQWLAYVVMLCVVAFGLGIAFGVVGTIIGGIGAVTAETVLLKIFAEVLTIGIIVAFTQTIMHLTKSSGATIAVITAVFLLSGVALAFLPQSLEFIDTYWVTSVLANSTDMTLKLGTRLVNVVAVLIYQGVFIFTSINIFKREQI